MRLERISALRLPTYASRLRGYAAYVCRVRRGNPALATTQEPLRLALVPDSPLTEADRPPRDGTASLLLALPDSLEGLAVLAEAGITAWEKMGVCVFRRP
jgi:hypothetical protein